MYVYKQTDEKQWTVGYYDPKGEWRAETTHDNFRSAAQRVHYLNGGEVQGAGYTPVR
jgi:hypothetical protein